MVLDGSVGDWRNIAPLVSVDDPAQIVRGAGAWTGPADASFGFALARDAQLLYFAAEVHDDQIVRTRAHGANEDALLVTIAAPAGNRTTTYDLMIFPGVPGQFPGRVRFGGARGGDVAGATVAETALAGRQRLHDRSDHSMARLARGERSHLRLAGPRRIPGCGQRVAAGD